MIICDSHVHSKYSFDGECEVNDICLGAIEKKITSITITDHCEVECLHTDKSEYGDMMKNIPLSFEASKQASEDFKGKLQVYTGVEMGQPLSNPKLRDKILSKCSTDFVLASLHSLEGMEDFYYLKYTHENIKDYLDRYFTQLIDISMWDGFDSLAHLTYPVRYMYAQLGEMPDLTPYDDKIEEIFSNLVKNKKALEINVGGCRSAVKAPQPDLDLVEKFRRAGGKYLTFGSDAHNIDALGKYMEKAREIALKAGFDSYCVYKNHEPIMIKL